MCIGIPMKVLEINGLEALCEFNGITKNIRIDFIENLKIGQYIMVHAGFGLNTLCEEVAEETIDLLEKLTKNS